MADTVETTPDREEDATWRRWLPWIVLAVVILVVAWLIWLYADLRTPAQSGVAVVPAKSVKVPDVVGMEAAEAESVLTEAGLEVEEDVSYDRYGEPGTVSSQAPLAGTRVPAGAVVIVDVVSGVDLVSGDDSPEPDYQGEAKGMTGRAPKTVVQVRVPDLIGLTESAAVAAVEARGLEARPMYQPRVNQPRRVIQQAPDAGDLTPLGSQVHFLIVVAP